MSSVAAPASQHAPRYKRAGRNHLHRPVRCSTQRVRSQAANNEGLRQSASAPTRRVQTDYDKSKYVRLDADVGKALIHDLGGYGGLMTIHSDTKVVAALPLLFC